MDEYVSLTMLKLPRLNNILFLLDESQQGHQEYPIYYIYVWVCINAASTNICFTRIANLSKNRFYRRIRGSIAINVIPSFMRQMIP